MVVSVEHPTTPEGPLTPHFVSMAFPGFAQCTTCAAEHGGSALPGVRPACLKTLDLEKDDRFYVLA